MCNYTQSCTLPALLVGIVGILALSSGSDAFDSRRLLESNFHGSQFPLLHWSDPAAPHFVPGISFVERFKLAVKSGDARVAALSARTQLHSQHTLASAPVASNNYYSPLFNLIFEYGMDITIGTPPQKFSAIADTGSDLVWVQCTPCDYCLPQNGPLYDPSLSSTYKAISCLDRLCLTSQDYCDANDTCSYSYEYGSGLTVGTLAYETITLTTTGGKQNAVDHFTFGCDKDTFLDLGGVDGLVGLGQGPLSFTTQLGSLFDHKFSYCLVSYYDSNTTASLLLFGDAAVPKQPIRYTPMVQNPNATYYGTPTFYYIGLKGIKVGGKSLDIPAGTFDISRNGTGGVVSDSGTTLTYLASPGFMALFNEMVLQVEYPVSPYAWEIGLDLCYDLKNVSHPSFPVVTMQFEGFDLDLPWQNVFVGGKLFSSIGNNDTYCLAFADSFTSFSIFGNVAQQNFQILHDRKKKVFGYASVECDKLKL